MLNMELRVKDILSRVEQPDSDKAIDEAINLAIDQMEDWLKKVCKEAEKLGYPITHGFEDAILNRLNSTTTTSELNARGESFLKSL